MYRKKCAGKKCAEKICRKKMCRIFCCCGIWNFFFQQKNIVCRISRWFHPMTVTLILMVLSVSDSLRENMLKSAWTTNFDLPQLVFSERVRNTENHQKWVLQSSDEIICWLWKQYLFVEKVVFSKFSLRFSNFFEKNFEFFDPLILKLKFVWIFLDFWPYKVVEWIDYDKF